VRAFKEMNGSTSRFYVHQKRMWDRLRGASPIGGGLVAVVGPTPDRGGRNRPQGEGGQVTGHSNARGYE
jgi:hypothetical protein